MADFKDFIPLLTGLMGGGFGLGGVYLANRMNAGKREQEALDAWWYKYAIDECIEPLLGFFSNTQIRLTHHIGLVKAPDALHIPIMPLQHLIVITGSGELSGFLMWCELLSEYGAPEQDILDFSDTLADVIRWLLMMQGIFMDTKLKQKGDIILLKKKPDIIYLSNKLDEAIASMKEIHGDNFPDAVKARARAKYPVTN